MAALRTLTDERDMRDSTALGTLLLESAGSARSAYGADIPLSEVYDFHVRLLPVPNFVDAQSSLERYGDPVVRHQERIESGIEVVLS